MVNKYVGSTIYNAAKQLFKSGASSGSGKAIKNIGANVPKSELDKLTRDVKILEQKAKATKALVNQNKFEIENPGFSKGKLTFDPNRRNVTKESVKKRNKKSEEMFGASKGKKFNKGGRVGLKGGTNLGMQSVKYGLDNKPEVTKLDRIAKFIAKDKKKKNKTPMDKAVKKKNKKRFV